MTAMTDGMRWALGERGSGPAVLLLHGFTGTAAAWDDHAEAFEDAFRVLAPCLPGHGGTHAPPAGMTVEGTADALAALLHDTGASPASVVGYSLGARVALRLAVAHPGVVARLVLESGSAGIADPSERERRRAADEALALRIERDGVEAFVEEWERQPVFATHAALPPDRSAAMREMRRGNTQAGLAASLRSAGQGAMQPLFDRLAEVRAPTLVVAGALDAIGLPRAEALARGIPGARLAVIGGVGHTPHDEAPAEFRRLVLDFLQEDPPA
jgi:2-succinyl-6-hydroxy-2,4-cyclohexadiene-1-carboxylate synthase